MSEAAPEPRRLHKATLLVRWLRISPQAAAGVVAASVGLGRAGLGPILLVILAAALVGAGFAFAIWWRFRYTVRSGEIAIESGLFHRQRRVIPYDRVQDIAIERRLLARLFGTARVRIETGGSAADEGDLDMIGLDDALALRDHIRRARRDEPGAEAPAEPAAAADEEPLLFAMDAGRLVFSGLFNFSLVFLAAIFAALQYFDDFGFIDLADLARAERADATAWAIGAVGLRATLGLIALLLALGLVAGVARTVARDFGFRLTRAEAGLRRRRGLFTLTEVVIPLRRTQVALIESGAVARLLGWYRLSFQTLGADPKEGGVQVAAPFARTEELAPILAEARFPEPPPRASFAHVPRRALLRWAGQYLAVGAIAAAAALLVEPRIGIAAFALLVAAVLALLRWRKHAYALDERALFVSSGLLRRRLWVIPFEKAQTIHVSRGPLQRALATATLLVDTAGASLVRAPEIVDLDSKEAERLADELLRRFHRARAETRAAR